MPVSADQPTTIGQQIRLQRPRNLRPPPPFTSADEPLIPKPNRISKSAMSSFFLETTRKKPTTGYPQTGSFLGLGCTASASQQVSVPAVIRSSADWDSTNFKTRKTKKKKKNKGSSYNGGSVKILSEVDRTGCVTIPDVWCGPGVGFSTDAVVGGSIDPVESDLPPRRNIPMRRKIDNNNSTHNSNHREGSSSVLPRRSQNQESNPYFEADSISISISRAEQTLLLSDRHHRHLRHGIAEMMMMQNGFVMGGILSAHDHFRDLRLNVDNMTYEQLLELGDRIGYVNTGLTEEEMKLCLQKVKPCLSNKPLADRKCCICQENYKAKDNVGKLRCEHRFHINCVKQWLVRKNTCPVCKTMPYDKS